MEKTARKVEFWWASVAGADCEPVEVATVDGERVAYTCGCDDPFYLDRPECPVVLVPIDWDFTSGGDGVGLPLQRPLTPAEERKAERAERRQERALRAHSWRGPR